MHKKWSDEQLPVPILHNILSVEDGEAVEEAGVDGEELVLVDAGAGDDGDVGDDLDHGAERHEGDDLAVLAEHCLQQLQEALLPHLLCLLLLRLHILIKIES